MTGFHVEFKSNQIRNSALLEAVCSFHIAGRKKAVFLHNWITGLSAQNQRRKYGRVHAYRWTVEAWKIWNHAGLPQAKHPVHLEPTHYQVFTCSDHHLCRAVRKSLQGNIWSTYYHIFISLLIFVMLSSHGHVACLNVATPSKYSATLLIVVDLLCLKFRLALRIRWLTIAGHWRGHRVDRTLFQICCQFAMDAAGRHCH